LLAPHRQVADLVDDQQPADVHRPVQRFLQATLPPRRLQQQHQLGRGSERHLPAALRGEIPERDRQMRLAHAARPEEHHVRDALGEGQAGRFGDLLARRAGRESEIIAVQRLDRGEARRAREHLPRPGPTHLTLTAQRLLQEVAERGLPRRRGLGRGTVEVRYRRPDAARRRAR